jgi:hypothetical protein
MACDARKIKGRKVKIFCAIFRARFMLYKIQPEQYFDGKFRKLVLEVYQTAVAFYSSPILFFNYFTHMCARVCLCEKALSSLCE